MIIINIDTTNRYEYQAFRLDEPVSNPILLNIQTNNIASLNWFTLASIYNEFYKPGRNIQFTFDKLGQTHPFINLTCAQQALGCFLLELQSKNTNAGNFTQHPMVTDFIKNNSMGAAQEVFEVLGLSFNSIQSSDNPSLHVVKRAKLQTPLQKMFETLQKYLETLPEQAGVWRQSDAKVSAMLTKLETEINSSIQEHDALSEENKRLHTENSRLTSEIKRQNKDSSSHLDIGGSTEDWKKIWGSEAPAALDPRPASPNQFFQSVPGNTGPGLTSLKALPVSKELEKKLEGTEALYSY